MAQKKKTDSKTKRKPKKRGLQKRDPHHEKLPGDLEGNIQADLAERLLVMEDLILRGYTFPRAVKWIAREYDLNEAYVRDNYIPMLRKAWQEESKVSGKREVRRSLLTRRLEDGFRRAATRTKNVQVWTVVEGRRVKVTEEVEHPDFAAMVRFAKLIAEVNGLREIGVSVTEDLGSILRKAHQQRVGLEKRREGVLPDESGDSATE